MAEPTSVILGRACAICWRPFEAGEFMRQTVEGVSRNLCSGCATRMFPVLPPEVEGSRIAHLNAKAMFAEAASHEPERLARLRRAALEGRDG